MMRERGDGNRRTRIFEDKTDSLRRVGGDVMYAMDKGAGGEAGSYARLRRC